MRAIEAEGNMQFQYFNHDPQNPNSLGYNFIQTLWSDSDDRLWIGTWNNGLDELQIPVNTEELPRFIHHRQDAAKEGTIRNDKINDIFRDTAGVLWVATAAGVDRIAPTANKFRSVSKIANDPNSLSDKYYQGNLER